MSDTNSPSLDNYDLGESASYLKESLRSFTGDTPQVQDSATESTSPVRSPSVSQVQRGVKIPKFRQTTQSAETPPVDTSAETLVAEDEKDKKKVEEKKGQLAKARSKSQVSFDTFTIGDCAIVFSVLTVVERVTQKWQPLYLFILSPHLWFFILPLAATLVCVGPKHKYLSFLTRGRNLIFYLFISYTVVFILDIYPKLSFR